MDNDECIIIASDGLDVVSHSGTTPVGTIWIDTSTMDTNVYTGHNGWTTITHPYREIMTSSVMFEDYMPLASELKSMCKEYPALEKAYEIFKTVYKMVEQDWNGKQNEQDQ